MDLNVSLTDDLVRFVESQVDSGRFASSSEVVREALRLLEARDAQAAGQARRLRQAWDEGLASGDFRPLDADAIKAEGRARMAAKRR